MAAPLLSTCQSSQVPMHCQHRPQDGFDWKDIFQVLVASLMLASPNLLPSGSGHSMSEPSAVSRDRRAQLRPRAPGPGFCLEGLETGLGTGGVMNPSTDTTCLGAAGTPEDGLSIARCEAELIKRVPCRHHVLTTKCSISCNWSRSLSIPALLLPSWLVVLMYSLQQRQNNPSRPRLTWKAAIRSFPSALITPD